MHQKRVKISTTVAPETYASLERLIASGRAHSLADAIDFAFEAIRREENRARLEKMMAAYYENGSPAATDEENEIARASSRSAHEINLDE